MMLHRDGPTHEWVPGPLWDLIITLDDAASEHYSMCFVEQEGTASSFQATTEATETQGSPSSPYTDRGLHYWTTPEAGGKVDRQHRTQFARAMHQLGVERIPGSPRETRRVICVSQAAMAASCSWLRQSAFFSAGGT